MRKLNSKGFTLIEVLSVIVILAVIMAIALPSITSSMDRQSCKVLSAKVEAIESMGQFYVSDNRANIFGTGKTLSSGSGSCKISKDKLIAGGYLDINDFKDSNKNEFGGYIIYTKTATNETYKFCIDTTGGYANQCAGSGVSSCSGSYNECVS